MFSDLTLGPSLKVKRWFTGCGELSFRWIQICIGSPMRRSSLHCLEQAPNHNQGCWDFCHVLLSELMKHTHA